MKHSLAALCPILASTAALALDVSDVSARQRWPWNNLVDIDFTLSGTEAGTFYQVDVAARFPGIEGDAVAAKSLVTEPVVSGDGAHRVTWDLAADHPGLVTSNFAARVTVTPLGDAAPVYMVIDLSAGPTAGAGDYPVRYTTQAPDLTDDTCRTTELWLRRCPAGTFTMGYSDYQNAVNSAWAPHTVTLTHPFYIGVFELTQRQWQLVKGTWPSYYANEACRDTRPVEKVSYQSDIRGNTGWTSANRDDTGVGSGTFVALLRERTGITWLDLPTEAQWEYAARAGTDYVYGYPDATELNIRSYARGANTPSPADGSSVNKADKTVSTDYGTAKVGTYAPNAWGLYDMLGNVSEWCGDGYARKYPTADGFSAEDFTDPRMDPYAPTSFSSGRVTRGGDITRPNAALSVYNRYPVGTADSTRFVGFRIAVTVK